MRLSILFATILLTAAKAMITPEIIGAFEPPATIEIPLPAITVDSSLSLPEELVRPDSSSNFNPTLSEKDVINGCKYLCQWAVGFGIGCMLSAFDWQAVPIPPTHSSAYLIIVGCIYILTIVVALSCIGCKSKGICHQSCCCLVGVVVGLLLFTLNIDFSSIFYQNTGLCLLIVGSIYAATIMGGFLWHCFYNRSCL